MSEQEQREWRHDYEQVRDAITEHLDVLDDDVAESYLLVQAIESAGQQIASQEQQVHDLTARLHSERKGNDTMIAELNRVATTHLEHEQAMLIAERERDAVLAAARARAERLHAALTRCVNLIGECEYGQNEDGTCPGDPPHVDCCQYCEGVAALTDSGDAAGQPLLAVVQAAREWAWFYLEPLPPPSKPGDDEIVRRIGRAQGALLAAVEALDGGHDAR